MTIAQFDPQQSPPTATAIAQAEDMMDRLRKRILHPEPDETPMLRQFGWSILDLLTLNLTEVAGPKLSSELTQKLYGELTLAFLDHVLPQADDLNQMDAGHVSELLKALRAEPPDATLLAAAFGVARLREFGRDRRLVYRSHGYRGRHGDPLADHFIEHVVGLAALRAGLSEVKLNVGR
jgi:hypothetical protein